ncbi:MAG: hypothetical protein AAB451_01500 [Patescibacteria group bacterium]
MKKTFLILLMSGVLAVASPALAKAPDNSFWSAIGKIVQDIMPAEEEGQEMMDEDFVDPREVQQALREIKDIKKELNRLTKQAKKLTNGGATMVSDMNALLEQVAGFENKINEGIDLRDNIQEFRDAQLWEEVNKFRAQIEIPKEITQWNKEIKKLEKMLGQKKYQSLGLDLERVKTKVAEVKDVLAKVQEFYNSGDYESAMGEFDDVRQDLYIGEISNVIQRTQELARRLKAVKNAEIKTQIQEAFSEVISNFNEGEYRVARELMDESWNDIMRTINQALTVGKKKGVSKENFIQMTDKLEEQMKNKAEEKKVKMQEMREPQPPVQETSPTTQPVQ